MNSEKFLFFFYKTESDKGEITSQTASMPTRVSTLFASSLLAYLLCIRTVLEEKQRLVLKLVGFKKRSYFGHTPFYTGSKLGMVI